MEKKWYQYPYVWFVIGIPATSVVMSMMLIYFAINGRDPMVVDDYYRRGKAINEVLTRDKLAAEMGLIAAIRINSKARLVALDIKAKSKLTLPDFIELKITHATLGELDQLIRLYKKQPGQYHGQLLVPGLQAGKWYLELGTKQWRVTAKTTLPNQEQILLHSSY